VCYMCFAAAFRISKIQCDANYKNYNLTILLLIVYFTDCLQLQVYRDEKERARNGHTKASLSLQDFLALESGKKELNRKSFECSFFLEANTDTGRNSFCLA
jgi:hypothetical protein